MGRKRLMAEPTTLYVRLDKSAHGWVMAEAERQGISAAEWVRRMIRREREAGDGTDAGEA